MICLACPIKVSLFSNYRLLDIIMTTLTLVHKFILGGCSKLGAFDPPRRCSTNECVTNMQFWFTNVHNFAVAVPSSYI